MHRIAIQVSDNPGNYPMDNTEVTAYLLQNYDCTVDYAGEVEFKPEVFNCDFISVNENKITIDIPAAKKFVQERRGNYVSTFNYYIAIGDTITVAEAGAHMIADCGPVIIDNDSYARPTFLTWLEKLVSDNKDKDKVDMYVLAAFDFHM